jgi:hypothetical protein
MALKLTFKVSGFPASCGRFLLAENEVDRRYDISVVPVQVSTTG